jgi:hypothetical protein
MRIIELKRAAGVDMRPEIREQMQRIWRSVQVIALCRQAQEAATWPTMKN